MMGYPQGAPRKMWFADTDEDAPDRRFPWSPYLQLDGHVVRADVYLSSEADCESYIREHLVGTGWMDGPRRYPCPDCEVPAGAWCRNLATGEACMTFHSERMRYQFGGWPS